MLISLWTLSDLVYDMANWISITTIYHATTDEHFITMATFAFGWRGLTRWNPNLYLVNSTENGGQQLLPTCKTLRPRQNDSHFRDIFKCIFENQNIWISIKISLTYVSVGSVDNMSQFVQVMALIRRKAITWTNDRYTAHWFISAYLSPHRQALHHWPFVRKSTVHRWISLTKGQ